MVTSGLGFLSSTWLSVVAVKKNSTQTITSGKTTQNISSGTLYWNCRGSAVGSAFFFLRWNAVAQKIRPHTITPTTSAAMTDQVHSQRILSACSVTPTGQPKRSTSSPEHPVASRATSPANAATLPTLFNPGLLVICRDSRSLGRRAERVRGGWWWPAGGRG